MRLSDPDTIYTLAVHALPVVVAWMGFGVPGALFATLAVVVAGTVARQRRVLGGIDPDLVELHTITYSHYVEKVRWCLDRTGITYREVPSIGILGILVSARMVPTLVVPAARTQVSESSQILRFLWGAWSARLAPERLRFLEPTAEAVALEKHFDNDLGVSIRLWSYWNLLEQRDLTLLMWGLHEPAIPQWQRTLLPILHPVLAAMLRRALGINEANAARGLVETKKVFAEVDAMLADGRRYLMGGDEPTFVDITFASLAALALFPEGYGGNAVSVRTAPLDRFAPAWRKECEALRSTPAGQFVARLYREERLPR